MTIKTSQYWFMHSCAVASIIVALVLIVIKSFILKETGAFSIQASLLDSAVDVFASSINLYAIRQSLKPASKNFRFGYGKVEGLAGLGQSFLILISASWFLIEKLNKSDFYSLPLNITPKAFLMMLSCSFLTLLLILWQRYILTKVRSIAIQADNLHFETDLYMDFGVLITFLCVKYLGLFFVDVLFGICALLFIAYKTYPILKQSLDVLMDRELPDSIRQKITETVYQNSHVINMHQLKTRSVGHSEYIQFHIVLDGHLTLLEAHSIADDIEKKLLSNFPSAQIIIHQDCKIDEHDEE